MSERFIMARGPTVSIRLRKVAVYPAVAMLTETVATFGFLRSDTAYK
jgi:hypothetical protein